MISKTKFRICYPKRLLIPSYKSVSRPKIKGKDYDLLSMFAKEGFYSDIIGDKIQDKIDSYYE